MSVASFPLRAFRARAPWWGGDLQTVRNHILHDYAKLAAWPAERLVFPMENGDRLNGSLHWPAARAGRPTVILIHGFTGCADSAYVLATAKHLLQAGFPVLRLNLRGAGTARADCRELYHAGRSDDLRAVIGALPSALSENGLAAVGFSLGGNMLLKYLGEEGTATPFAAAVSISAPIDLVMATQRINAARNWIYHRWLVANTSRDWLNGPSILDAGQRQILHRARTLYEIDDRIVGPINGFAGADDYYDRTSANAFVGGVAVPTLVIHAANDPWIPAAMYRAVDWAANDSLSLQLTGGGGHVGFHGHGGRWHDMSTVDFLNAVC